MAISTQTLSDVAIPRSQQPSRAFVRDALVILGSTVALALLAQVSIPLQPVPITGQTFGVLLIGAALGWKRGGLALLAYLAEGVAGLPVFAEGKAGWVVLSGPTGGYLVGFVFAAMLVGFLAERGWSRLPWLTALAMVLGNVVIYLVGVPWLAVYVASVAHLPFDAALRYAFQNGLTPFIVGDVLKLVAASLVLPGAWLALGKRGK